MNIAPKQRAFSKTGLFVSKTRLNDKINSRRDIKAFKNRYLTSVNSDNQRFRVIALTFRRSTETISHFFREVLFAVGELRNEMILPPSPATPTKILHGPRWNPYFEDYVGAIDGTHVLARVPAIERVAFLGRKHTTTQNVMAAVDFDLRFTYVLAGWEGSAHDALILADALERDDGLKFPQGKYFLVDAGYAARPGFLPPYRSTKHSALRVTVERAFGALKNRFKILYNKPFHPYPTQVKFVLACCILHNWILRHGEDEHVPAEASWEANQVNDAPPDEVAPDNQAWVAMRDTIANQMWAARAAHHGKMDEANPVLVDGVEQERNNGGAAARFHWDATSEFILRRFADLVSEGLKTDKGFKEDHPKDVEFLNTPILHYQPMEAIFGGGVATGRYAMGSNEPLDIPDTKTIDLDNAEEDHVPIETKPKVEPPKKGKRKRVPDDEAALMCNFTEAIKGFSAAVGDAIPGLYQAVMGCPGFTREALMAGLGQLTEKKAIGLMFVEMTNEDRDLWLRAYLPKNYYMT
ncbi:hypothetical protein U9M48_037691 [Paspalum notatum var. saurae]|uniref:DDE Tnp4 domain-containing protein n=1 Tax=Paspalum notatum var. saurae TaxID=547442 RepID=A0AAQ3UKC6_PASNO